MASFLSHYYRAFKTGSHFGRSLLLQNECDSIVQNSGVEDGYHSNWMHVGGEIKLVQGTVVDDVHASSSTISTKEDLLPIMAPVNLWILAFRLVTNIMK